MSQLVASRLHGAQRIATKLGRNQLEAPSLTGALMSKRSTAHDYCSDKIGTRQIVGYGWNGSPCYADMPDFPFPAIRFQEPSKEICLLREKERSDWKKLSLEEMKTLYRYSFCQTFSEMKAPSAEWKLAVGVGLWACAIGFLMTCSYFYCLYGPLPETFDEEHRQAQLKRIIALEMNPVTGLASKWDYKKNRWKKKKK